MVWAYHMQLENFTNGSPQFLPYNSTIYTYNIHKYKKKSQIHTYTIYKYRERSSNDISHIKDNTR